MIQQAVEDADINFLHTEGVQISNRNIVYFQPNDGLSFLIEDINRCRPKNLSILFSSNEVAEVLLGSGLEKLQMLIKEKSSHANLLLVCESGKPKTHENISVKHIDTDRRNVIFFISYNNRYILLPNNLSSKTSLMIIQSHAVSEHLQIYFKHLWQSVESR